MSELRESITLDIPPDQAERCLFDFFERHRTADGTIRIPLQVMHLGHPVTVHLRKQRDAQNLNDEIAMGWDPGADEPFPSFEGRMILWSETPAQTCLELRGTYEPPLGGPGKVFDDALGRALAKSTARNFLLTLAQGARECFQQ